MFGVQQARRDGKIHRLLRQDARQDALPLSNASLTSTPQWYSKPSRVLQDFAYATENPASVFRVYLPLERLLSDLRGLLEKLNTLEGSVSSFSGALASKCLYEFENLNDTVPPSRAWAPFRLWWCKWSPKHFLYTLPLSIAEPSV